MRKFVRISGYMGLVVFIILCFIGLWMVIDFIMWLGFEYPADFVVYFIVTIIALISFLIIIARYVWDIWQTQIKEVELTKENKGKDIDKETTEEERYKGVRSSAALMIPLTVDIVLLFILTIVIVFLVFYSPVNKPLYLYGYLGVVYLFCLYIMYDIIKRNADTKRNIA